MTFTGVLSRLLETLIVIALAPLLTGWVNQWRAWLQNKSAPSLWQPYRVLHKLAARKNQPPRYRMVCHHCSADTPVPRACPDCGNIDLTPVGRGTQRLEEGLQQMFPDARIARLDQAASPTKKW